MYHILEESHAEGDQPSSLSVLPQEEPVRAWDSLTAPVKVAYFLSVAGFSASLMATIVLAAVCLLQFTVCMLLAPSETRCVNFLSVPRAAGLAIASVAALALLLYLILRDLPARLRSRGLGARGAISWCRQCSRVNFWTGDQSNLVTVRPPR